MMDLEPLREAARLMRERATAATPGPWTGRTTYPHLVLQGCDEEAPGMVATTLAENPAADADHIASWNPAVALAVADWLDTGANPYSCVAREPMLRVAHAYLGTQP